MISVDMILAFYPILILNYKVFDLNNHWYFYAIILSLFSVIDPFFQINFARHKISFNEYKIHIFRIAMSAFIITCGFIFTCLGSGEQKTIEQANDIFFIVFSLFCFTKFLTFFVEIIFKNKVVKKALVLLKQTYPFVLKMSILYTIILLFYAFLGQAIFGGKITNYQISEYENRTGLKLKENYCYLHFNDIFSSFLTLVVLLIQNNWVYVTEILFFIQKGTWENIGATMYIVSYGFLSAFLLTSLFFGIISRLIMYIVAPIFSQVPF